jgi:hypothetical protein
VRSGILSATLLCLARWTLRSTPTRTKRTVKFTDEAPVIGISEGSSVVTARLLSLDGAWHHCALRQRGKSLWIEDAAEGIRGGMSGSPILADDETAIGLVSVAGGQPSKLHTSGGPVLDHTGRLAGIVVSKLDALVVAQLTGDIRFHVKRLVSAGYFRRSLRHWATR